MTIIPQISPAIRIAESQRLKYLTDKTTIKPAIDAGIITNGKEAMPAPM